MKTIIFLLFSMNAFLGFSQALEPTETIALLKVLVVNDKQQTLEGETVSFIAKAAKKTYTGVTNEEGRFEIMVPEGDTYTVGYKAFTANQDYSVFEIPVVDGFVNFDYKLTIEAPKVYTLDNVFFDSGKTTLKPGSFKELDELKEYMTRKKSLIIEIAGHTDNVGDKVLNQKLSENRATTVRNYLIGKGIKAERIQSKGYGDSQPVGDNTTDAGKQKNRRTEVRTLKQ